MPYTDPDDAVTGELAPAALWNTGVRDNMKTLGLDTLQVHAGTTDLECWYPCGPSIVVTPSTTTNPAANTMVAVPFFPRRSGTIDRLAFEVTTLAAGNGRAGIYRCKSPTNIYPGDLVVDGGSISVNTTGVKTATVSAVPPDFVCWAVYVQSAVASIRAFLRTAATPVLGMPSTLGAAQLRSSLTVAFTFGALPATFPAGATVDTSSDVALVAVRYSA